MASDRSRTTDAPGWLGPMAGASGITGLLCQVAWFHALRFVVGTSTAAAAVGTALFMGGLAAGSGWFGRRAEGHPRPLALFARLEGGIAAGACLSLPLLAAAQSLIPAGPAGTGGRFLLAALAILGPTFLMGGTIPALGRAVVPPGAHDRRAFARLYGLNTLGAAAGAFLGSFLLLPALGARRTVLAAALLDACLGLLAWRLARQQADGQNDQRGGQEADHHAGRRGDPRDGQRTGDHDRQRDGQSDDRQDAPQASGDSGAAAAPGLAGSLPPTPHRDLVSPILPGTAENPCAPAGEAVPREAWPAGLTSAFLTGAGFFLMEVVWFRLVGPLLGGTVQAFGLLLVAILLGLAVGAAGAGTLAAREKGPLAERGTDGSRRRPGSEGEASGKALVGPLERLEAAGSRGPEGRQDGPSTILSGGPRSRFGGACLLAGLGMSLPFALGDWIPLQVARALAAAPGGGWWPAGAGVVLGSVVLPGAILGGLLPPLLIAEAGAGRRGIAVQAGWLLAANTLGGLLGSVVGGVWLLPALTLNGCWILATALFVAAARVAPAAPGEGRRRWFWALTAACFLPFLAHGPTAFWRHCHPPQTARMIRGRAPDQVEDVMRATRRRIVWEREGRETALAISNAGGLTLLTNGNGEGNVTLDDAMLIGLGLVSAVRHPAPRQALVIGLGTGCTAGWLAEVPGLERVDVFELEPALTDMASRCAAINHDVLRHPRVHLRFGDGRLLLQAATATWDLVVSGPSNLFRAGMAGLFSQDFFRDVAGRLRPGGLFGLWVQVYEIDREGLQTILRTLGSVFPHIEGWLVDPRHLLLLAGAETPSWELPGLSERLQLSFWRQAFRTAWRVTRPEGVLARALGPLTVPVGPDEPAAPLNTDDHLVLEFQMGRLLGHSQPGLLATLLAGAPGVPLGADGAASGIDRRRLALERLLLLPAAGLEPLADWPTLAPAEEGWRAALRAQVAGRWSEANSGWPPAGLSPLADLMGTEVLAHLGDARTLVRAAEVRAFFPAEADLVLARYFLQTGEVATAGLHLAAGFRRLADPLTAWPPLVSRSLDLARGVVRADPTLAPGLFEALGQAFFLDAWNEPRLLTRLDLGLAVSPAAAAAAFHAFEPHVPWSREFLSWRARAYQDAGDPLAGEAADDLQRFTAGAGPASPSR